MCSVGVSSVAGFGVSFVATFVVASAACSTTFSGGGSRVEVLSNFFIGINLLLKLSRMLSVALNNNPKLFKKNFFSSVSAPFSKFLNSIPKLLCLRSAFLTIKLLHKYLFKKICN